VGWVDLELVLVSLAAMLSPANEDRAKTAGSLPGATTTHQRVGRITVGHS
jgi:hypothetical protein